MSACSLLVGSSYVFLLIGRQGLTWELIFEIDGTFICLFSSFRIFRRLSFSFGTKCLDLEGLSFRKRKFELREGASLSQNDFFTLGVILFSLGMTFSPW